MGFNPYVECDPVTHTEYAQSTGLKILMKEYSEAACARPILFGEFGCNAGLNTIDGFENQRSFYDVSFHALDMSDTAVDKSLAFIRLTLLSCSSSRRNG